MFGISGEHLLILGIVLLLFGPKKLPELGNTMGKAIRNFKDALSGVEEAKFRRLEEEEQRKNASSPRVADSVPNSGTAHSQAEAKAEAAAKKTDSDQA